MKTINLTDEEFEKVQSVLKKAESKPENKIIIYKTDGSALYESDKKTIKEAAEEAVEHEANLGGADLREADLREADLWGANLWGANLGGANLGGANLREADLGEAELYDAKFYGKGGTTKITKSQVNDFFEALGIIVK